MSLFPVSIYFLSLPNICIKFFTVQFLNSTDMKIDEHFLFSNPILKHAKTELSHRRECKKNFRRDQTQNGI